MNPREARAWREEPDDGRVWSPGWGTGVVLGDGQRAMVAELERIAKRNPSQMWHETRMRALGRLPGKAHALVWSLRSRGVIAVQKPLRGCLGGTQFTFGVRYWRRAPIRAGMLRRFHVQHPPQMELAAAGMEVLAEPPRQPEPPRVPATGTFGDLMAGAGFAPWWQT